jgi:hypothetical protein
MPRDDLRVMKKCSRNLRRRNVVASGLGGCSGEVHLVVHVVTSIGSLSRGRVEGTASSAGVGVEDVLAITVVGGKGVQGTAEGTEIESA